MPVCRIDCVETSTAWILHSGGGPTAWWAWSWQYLSTNWLCGRIMQPITCLLLCFSLCLSLLCIWIVLSWIVFALFLLCNRDASLFPPCFCFVLLRLCLSLTCILFVFPVFTLCISSMCSHCFFPVFAMFLPRICCVSSLDSLWFFPVFA